MKTIGNIIDYGTFSLFDFSWHYWESEWHISIFHFEWGEHDRSLISIGWRDGLWLDLLWLRITPRHC